MTPELAQVLKAPMAPTTGGAAPSREDVLGHWVPYPARSFNVDAPFIAFDASGSWTGSDGCNGVGGRWSLGGEGGFVAVTGPSTLIGCEGADVGGWVSKARGIRLHGDVLSFFDADGREVGKLSRSCAAQSIDCRC